MLITVLLAGLFVAPACSSNADTTTTSTPSADLASGEPDDELAELQLGDSLDAHQLSEFGDFCTALSEDLNGESGGPQEVLARYRSALEFAPVHIVNELAALLEYLEFGTLPDFGTLPSPSTTQPVNETTQEPDDEPVDEPVDEYVFISPGPEQLALSVAEFIDQYCRSVTVSPLPPPTVPSSANPHHGSES